jgi:NADH dehydrogenase
LSLPHVVIVGAGFGGLDAARALEGAPVRVTVVDRHNYHLFQPLLYQVATAALSPGDIASPIRWVLRKQRNAQVLLAEVRTIDPASRTVWVARGGERPADVEALSYDYLILAAGATDSYFGHDEWATRALGIKSLDQALDVRRQVLLAFEAAERAQDAAEQRRLLTFVIVGGGPTGVELAGALSEIARHSLRRDFRNARPESARIVLLEGNSELLPAFPDSLRRYARRALERLGIEVQTDSFVTDVDALGVTVRSRRQPNGAPVEKIDAQTVLWAAGVVASPLARSLGAPLDRAGRVIVEPTLAVPGQPRIFVVGDLCACSESAREPGRYLPGVAQVAKQEGRRAARNVLRALAGRDLRPLHYRDYGSLATIGRGSAVASIGGAKLTGMVAWLIWIFVHIFWLIGFRNRVAVISEWAWAYVTLQRRVRLITGEKLWPGSA